MSLSSSVCSMSLSSHVSLVTPEGRPCVPVAASSLSSVVSRRPAVIPRGRMRALPRELLVLFKFLFCFVSAASLSLGILVQAAVCRDTACVREHVWAPDERLKEQHSAARSVRARKCVMSVSPLLLLLLATLPALAGPAGPGGPSFAPRQQRAVAARAGDVAALECRVRGLADRAVSWVRSSDLQILTHAGAVFTADSRVSCSEASYDTELEDGEEFSGAGSQHTLRIERLRVGDSGRYECQVNTEPKMSLFYNLTVVESSLPRVVVRVVESGARGVSRVPAGGSARLSCEARYQPAAGSDLPDDVLAAMTPLRVTWTHEGEAIDPQSPRGGISLDTERWSGHVLSRLTLARTTTADAGRYWCGAGDVGAVMHLRVGDNKEYEPGGERRDGEAEWMQRDQAVARVSGAGPLGPTTTSLLPVLPVLPVLLLLSLNT